MSELARVESLEEAAVHIDSLRARIDELERLVSDHAQRWDTIQSAPWKRFWFWFWEGWPLWADLNAPARRKRPWH